MLEHIDAPCGAGYQRQSHRLRGAAFAADGAFELRRLEAADVAPLAAPVDRLDVVAQHLVVAAAGAVRRQADDHPGVAGIADQCDRRRRVAHPPAGRRGQRDAQVGVHELAAASETLFAAFAKGHAVYRLQVAVATVVAIAALMAGGDLPDVGQPLVVAGVRGQPAGRLRRRPAGGACVVGGELFLALQHADHVDHVLRVVAVARQVFGAELVGLQFLVATVVGHVARGRGLRDLAGGLCRAADAAAFEYRAEHGGRQHAQAGALLPRGALGAMARRDMADLVADDTGKFGLAVQIRHDAARDVDVTAGQCKRVDLGAVEHRERPLQVGAVRLRRQLLPDTVDVGLQPHVAHRAVVGQDLLVCLAAFGDFFLLAHHRAFGAA